MFKVGLSSFKDHPDIQLTNKSTLYDYARSFNLIELDLGYHVIPAPVQVDKWLQQVPPSFQFIPKAYAGMTLQESWQRHYESESAMFTAFAQSYQLLREAGKLGIVLFQFSQSFDFSNEHGAYLQKIRHYLPDWPIAVEFRHGSWFQREALKKTLGLFQRLKLSLVAVDEPQRGTLPVPFFIYPTSETLLVRCHGRNLAGWVSGKKEYRTLYQYPPEELQELQAKILKKAAAFKNVYIIFNNNAGHHAALNAKSFASLLDLPPVDLHPNQLDLF